MEDGDKEGGDKPRGLQGLRVIELGGPVAAPAAGKLFADLGATVIKVEPPGGEPGRTRPPLAPPAAAEASASPTSGAFLHLNANKRSLVLDLADSTGHEAFTALLEDAHLFLHDLAPGELARLGLDLPALCAAHPGLVAVSMTPFGLDGPYADYLGADLPLVHGGGLAWLTPDRSPSPEHPPLRPYGMHALMQAGLHGAVTGLACCLAARRTGVGEHVDLSAFEVGVNLLCRHFTSYTYSGVEESRLGRNLASPAAFFRCKDGFIYLIAVEQDQWERLVDLMGHPAWAEDPAFSSPAARGEIEAQERLEQGLSDFCADWPVEELFHACQARRIGSSPVTTAASLANDPHLKARQFFQPLRHEGLGALHMPGAPFRLEKPAWALRAPAPALGEMNAAGKARWASPPEAPLEAPPKAGTPGNGRPKDLGRPLEGVRVLDLSWVWAGPYTAQLLAFLGAEVIKVESSGRVDIARRLNLYPPGLAPGVNRNAYFNQIGQGKKSFAVDLRNPEGLATVKALAARSDVVLSNFATGVVERLGLGREELRAIKPDLIVANLSAYGQTGPYRHYIGYGPAMPPLAGLAALTGYEDDAAPRNLRVAYADPNAGVYLAFAILAELMERQGIQGQGTQRQEYLGQRIDISLWETLLCTAFEGWMAHALGAPSPLPLGNHDPQYAPHNLFRCRGEDAWVAVAVTDESQWQGLCRALAREDWAREPSLATHAGRKAREAEMDPAIAEWCANMDKWKVTEVLQREGVPAFPALSNRELAENEHLWARDFLVRHDHPEVGGLVHNGVPWRMAHRPNGAPSRAPLLGEHTEEVLRDVLALTPEAIASLREIGAIE